MRQVERSAIVPFSAGSMFELVADVESYPAFLPGCTSARIHERDGHQVIASIALAEGPLRTEFRTRNVLDPSRSIDMQLEDGPFSSLHGVWVFVPLGPAGSRVSLSVRFAFSSRAIDLLLGPVFEALCNRLVDAFVERARDVYGSGSTNR
ncbi:MAG: type II toxin-antitoxin system RatA family toxin [Proteobacteria bacterium]|nr:MAG: type II toxin-antitoxin system RatA family toxin [Pseudomonadota bacterium]MBC6943843.1 type II toxin-antitoxin system RatA family toxin [Gammaproteobacteria bacterium]MCE7895353.1 type II toxin-antitoxin system RatA family toxin [Gammaproteobacteria bacterium PRO8]MDL1880159.1 type II toxin-antitoxin system RatA family toxin [Gammaproteobacteria bacterium PRO2]MCL4776219.1 type II toxin-antitoxin system RatA family toxin [Gammaproteobacteria bacterium]